MAGRIHKLRQRRVDLTAEGRALFDAAAAEDRGLNDAERGRDDEIQAELAEVVESIEAEERQLERERGLARIERHADEPAGDPGDPAPVEGFARFGDYLAAIHRAYTVPGAGGYDERLNLEAAAAGMEQAVNSEGGFLVPSSFSNTIWDGMNEAPDNLLGMTDQYTVEGDSLTFPANAETSRATGSRYGGVQGYWINEADTITSSRPKFRDVKIEPHEVAVLVYVTDKLLRNSPTALEQYITRAATEELNFFVGDAIINGTGVGRPLGIQNSGCLVTVAKETGQEANTIVSENISKMWARLHTRSRSNAVWLHNGDILPELDNLQVGVGTAGELVWMRDLSGTPRPFLKGRPLVETEYNETLGTAGDLILADMKGYATGVKGGVMSAMSMHIKFDSAQTAFRFIFEVDGQSWLNSAITPYKGTATRSTFVRLATRA